MKCCGIMSFDSVPQRNFVKGNNKFTVMLFNEALKNREDSFLLSPTLMATALILILSGSKQQTCKEILRALGLNNKTQDVEELIKAVKLSLGHTITFTNKLYVKKDTEVKENFRNVAKEVHETSIEHIDFSKSLYTIQTVNSWVLQNSRQCIKDLLESSDLNNVTDSMLVSVSNFKASWICPFLIANTKKGLFHKSYGEIIEVDYMNCTDKYLNFCDNFKLQAKFLEMPFLGQESSMIFVLPNKIDGLPDLEKRIDKIINTTLAEEMVTVSLPKFKVVSKHLLKKILQNIGVFTMFREDEADLSDIAEDKGEFVISEIVQGVTIDISEDGIGAAAGAAVLIPVPHRSMTVRKRTKSFIADHPFLFLIKIKKIIIYTGRILEPMQ